MPITKIPITHKFGIISQSQREELQNRLLHQKYQKAQSPTQHQALRNPLELTEAFIQKFNLSSDLDEKEQLEDEARKLLARAKRRAGLKEGGKGNFVDLPKAWSELSMLAQCRGKVQEECLDVLIISLNQAHLARSYIPCLFYLAETTLYWLRTDAMNQPFLRIGEIKLLKMGYTTFLCLFYHHMAGHLNPFGELKDRLATYLSAILDDYDESEEAYGPYPGSHLCLKFIVSVAKMIAGESLIAADGLLHEAQPTDTEYGPSATEKNSESLTPVSPPNSVLLDALKEAKTARLAKEETIAEVSGPQMSGYQSSIHDLSPTLWHALDVWRCSDHLGKGFHQAVRALSHCGRHLATEHWVDSSCAIRIIGETALGNITVLKVFQNLAKGSLPKSKSSPEKFSEMEEAGDEDDLASLESGELSAKNSTTTSLDSMEIKFEEMLGLRGQSAAEGEEIQKMNPLGLCLGRKKMSDASQISHQKSTRNTSMCAYLDTPLHDRATSFMSGSAIETKHSPGSSSYRTIPDISSCNESQLDSAGGMKRWSGSHLSDVHDVNDEDSDLAPGDNSLVDQRNDDVTKANQSTCTNGKTTTVTPAEENLDEIDPRLTCEISLEVDMISDSPSNKPKRKSSIRVGQGTTQGRPNRSPSTKSVVIDPVPSTNFYSEGSEGTSEKMDLPKIGVSATKQAATNNYGITGWPWEVAYVFTETLTNICLYGKNANIKKFALIGNRTGLNVTQPKKAGEVSEHAGVTKLKSAGLLDLAEIKVSKQKDEDVDDWSWRVRYAAISGLVKISRSCQNDQSMEGMSNVVWNMLMIRHSKERDERVMEAFRVGQVDAQLECEMQKGLTNHSLHFKFAAGLASNYLPPLEPPVQPAKRKPKAKAEISKPKESPRRSPARPSLRQELQLATALPEPQISFYSRKDLDLKRIVEDQWRKELQEEMEAEEKQKQEELEKKQREIEKEQLEIAEKKEEKLGKSLSSEEMTAA
ncbi:uncharacterized protein [Apostichopus japonicus]|uniref:uncharacterized protein isoform X2 n=1 Tax=Stichopus japonicus TaxID=307972 RepID=UPI003AB2B95F